MAIGTNKINGITFHFSTDYSGKATINRIDLKSGVKKIVFPEVVQLDGRKYVVTGISGTEQFTKRWERVTDKRRKNYGDLEACMSSCGWNKVCSTSWGDVKKVKLPKTLKCIGPHAFKFLPTKSIDIPNGVVKIAESAFEDAKLEGTITIPSSVWEIGQRAFSGSKKITLKIKNKEGAVKFGYHVVDSEDCVKYVGKGFLSKLFGK